MNYENIELKKYENACMYEIDQDVHSLCAVDCLLVVANIYRPFLLNNC